MSEHDRAGTGARDGTPESGEVESQSVPEAAGPRGKSAADVRAVYADRADTMARFAAVNRLLSGRYRSAIFGRATGRVLDVACGTATNLEYLPDDVEYVGVDLSPAMLATAEANFECLERGENLHEMDAADLAFQDDSFDTVISSFSTCTFPDPVAALNEMNRVCEPGGRILLLEHGRSDVGVIARVQDWRADAHYEKHACRLTQEPIGIVERADPEIVSTSTYLAGIITAIEARPEKDSSD